ncbi:MAG: cell wall-binding repeat-containing protein [Actinobacteria bacterium]|nr:cell wall-binding repeat-containing protein [Actinomycetota bacterium]
MTSTRLSTLRLVAAAAVVALMLTAVQVVGAPSAAAAQADKVPPETIKVCRDNYGGGAVETVPFKDYVRDVLPYEFGGDAPREYLIAGSVAVASYAWYHVEHPYSSRCHLSDGGQHQHYRPGAGFRTSHSDSAVDAAWHLAMTEVRGGEVTPAYAQYCSRSCAYFPPGEHLNQYEAWDQAEAGWSAVDILRSHYRNKDQLTIEDWREGLDVRTIGRVPVGTDRDPLEVAAAVDGVPAGHPDAVGRLLVQCTLGGTWGVHHIGTAQVTSGNEGPEVRFDASRIRDCVETDVLATIRLLVNGYVAGATALPVWEPWVSSSSRETIRVAETSDPTVGSAAISHELFADAGVVAAGDRDEQGRRPADEVVIARSDRFADALSAAGLAGPTAPILLNPSGSGLRDELAAEIERILPDGATVRIVGGPQAVSQEVEDDPRLDRYQVVRHWGETRIGTALAVADAVRDTGGDTSVTLVARAFPDTTAGWADAVTVGGFAAARRHPLVLTTTGSLDGASEAWIEDAGNGVEEAVLLGGPAAVPADAEERLDVRVTRVAGDSRNGTATAIADQLWTRDGMPSIRAAMIVDVWNDAAWPFALAGSVYAANRGTPGLATTHLVPRHTTGAWLDDRPDLPAVFIGDDRIVTTRAERYVAGG